MLTVILLGSIGEGISDARSTVCKGPVDLFSVSLVYVLG